MTTTAHEPICYVPVHPGRTCRENARHLMDLVWEQDTVTGRPDQTPDHGDHHAFPPGATADHPMSRWAETVTARADHPRVTLTVVTDALRQLGAQLCEGTGMGPDGPFVDVSGERLYMLPEFPMYLARMLELHERKNREYRGSDPDPLANYVNAGKAAGRPGWEYAFERMAEKMNRASHVLPGASAPVVVDTLMDLAVISLLVLSLRLEER